MSHLLVTNDFPPKVGGIQSYLYELWRRLPSDRVTVLTSSYAGAAEFDAAQAFRIERAGKVLLPTKAMVRRIEALADEVDADLIVLDPAVPLGIVGPKLSRPYAAVLHGAEVTVPGRLPLTKSALAKVLRGATAILSAGPYPEDEARRLVGKKLPPTVNIPPGVDVEHFVPLDSTTRNLERARLGVAADAELVVSVSRLVPRKGMDTLIRAVALLTPGRPRLQLVIAGSGRDLGRLERLTARLRAPVRFVGRVPEAELPALYGCGDVFAMLCRARWGGLEQEGFGIVFLEAAAAGVPQLAGRSGGASDAVVDGETGLICDDPSDPSKAASALERLFMDLELRAAFSKAGRARAESEFSYDVLARRLNEALVKLEDQHK